MTDHDADQDRSDVHALSGAYAVDALEADERARFEDHLERCADCRAEVADLRETAAELGHGDVVAPPAGLREQVLAGIETIRPLPPLAAPPAVSDELGSRRRARLGGLGRLTLVAAAVLIVALAATALWMRPWSDDASDDLTAAEQVLAADDAERVDDRLPDGTRATLVVSRSEGRAVLLVDDLAPPPGGTDYQLWLQTPEGDLTSAGLVPDGGDTTVALEGDASEATGAGITVEPDGGSEQPTTNPIAFFVLEA